MKGRRSGDLTLAGLQTSKLPLRSDPPPPPPTNDASLPTSDPFCAVLNSGLYHDRSGEPLEPPRLCPLSDSWLLLLALRSCPCPCPGPCAYLCSCPGPCKDPRRKRRCIGLLNCCSALSVLSAKMSVCFTSGLMPTVPASGALNFPEPIPVPTPIGL